MLKRSCKDISSIENIPNLPFFVLNLGFDIVDSVRGLYFKCDGFPSESKIQVNIHFMIRMDKNYTRLDKYLHLCVDASSVQRCQRWSL
jgi:hypothetical protein